MKRKAVDVRLSKELSRVLRHAPPASMDASGWVSLPVLALHLRSKPSEADIREIVLSSDKVGVLVWVWKLQQRHLVGELVGFE